MMSSVYMRGINVLAVVVVILWLIPVAWVALNSVKPTNVINAETPTFYSFEPTASTMSRSSTASASTAPS